MKAFCGGICSAIMWAGMPVIQQHLQELHTFQQHAPCVPSALILRSELARRECWTFHI